jgi:hypothetical protein
MIFGTLQTNNLSQTSSQPHFVVFNKSLKMRCTNIVLDHWPWIVERLGKFSAPDQRLITKEVTHPSSGGGGGAHSSNHCWVKNRRISVRCSPCNELGNIVSRHQHLHCIHLQNAQLHLNKTTNDNDYNNNNNSFSKPQITDNWVFES